MMFYLTTHPTHFIYFYMVSGITYNNNSQQMIVIICYVCIYVYACITIQVRCHGQRS